MSGRIVDNKLFVERSSRFFVAIRDVMVTFMNTDDGDWPVFENLATNVKAVATQGLNTVSAKRAGSELAPMISMLMIGLSVQAPRYTEMIDRQYVAANPSSVAARFVEAMKVVAAMADDYVYGRPLRDADDILYGEGR